MGFGWRVAAVLVGFLICGTAFGETEPSPGDGPAYSSSLWPAMMVRPAPVVLPRQQNPHLLDDALYAGIASYRTLDYLSTRRALAGGAHEVMLPQWVVNNRGTFIAFEGLATITEVGGSVWLIRHGHRRMARAVNSVSLGLGFETVVHNYRQPLGAPPLAVRP